MIGSGILEYGRSREVITDYTIRSGIEVNLKRQKFDVTKNLS